MLKTVWLTVESRKITLSHVCFEGRQSPMLYVHIASVPEALTERARTHRGSFAMTVEQGSGISER